MRREKPGLAPGSGIVTAVADAAAIPKIILVVPLVSLACHRPDHRTRAAQDLPSFKRDIVPVFERSCLGAEGCHGNRPTDAVSLDLRPQAAYAALVGVPAERREGTLRVRPGDAGASFLVDKLTGQLRPREGKRMPLDETTGLVVDPSPVSTAFLDRVLKPWIAVGAPNN